MVRRWRWAAVSMSLLLLGCPSLLKKKGEDGGADGSTEAGASASAEAGPVAVASNDSDVTHYPDQTPANNETLTTHITAAARTEASNAGKLVADVRPGTECQKLADHEGFDLVVFPDPKDATQKLEGWVFHTAFGWVAPVHPADAGAPPAVADGGSAPACTPKPLDLKKNANGSCNPGYASCGAMCRATCKADADCCLATAHCQGGYCLGPGAQPCSK